MPKVISCLSLIVIELVWCQMPGKKWTKGRDEWQEHIVLLLKRRYGPTQFQEIPDRDRGDNGLEGFARDGSAYQCYVAEEPLSTEDLTRKQQIKITKDLKKLKNNHDSLKQIFGKTKISRWIFVVPRWESKELIKHAEKKAEEIRNASLPYIEHDFCVQIVTEEDFPIERQEILGIGLNHIQLEPDEVEMEGIADWSIENDIFIGNLDRKIGILLKKSKRDEKLKQRDRFIKYYLEGQNVLEKLHSEYPDMHTKVRQQKNGREKFLETSSRIPVGSPADVFNKSISEYKTELNKEVLGLSSIMIETLVYEALSDWLLRCPLDFPYN